MSPDRGRIGSPRDWLSRARSNLAKARQPKPDEVYWEDLCFDAQRAAEKALKAVLLARQVPFRFVHDLAELLSVLEQHAGPLPDAVRDSAALTEFAVEARYPGPSEPVTAQEFREALAAAEAVVAWAEAELARIEDRSDRPRP